VRETIERALSGDRTEFDVVHRTKSGEERDVHVITQLLQLGGQPVFHTIWHDVTERTQAQRALQASEQFLQAIIETEPECVKLVARDGSLQFMNRAGLAMLGVDAFDQVRGQCMYPFVVPEHRDAFRAQVESVFGGRSSSLEFEVLGAKGNRLRLQSHATPLRTAGQEIRAMLAVTRDVTGQRKAEEELTRVQRLESLALLAGGVAHDFNNLLTVIMANLSLVMSALPRDGEAYRHLQEAETASQRTAELTRQLLTFAKGGAPIKATASLAEVLRESAGFAVRGSRVRCDLRVSTESSLVETPARSARRSTTS
jgi:PAS domain S-box-containing protein